MQRSPQSRLRRTAAARGTNSRGEEASFHLCRQKLLTRLSQKKAHGSGSPQTDPRVAESPSGSSAAPVFHPLSGEMLLKVHNGKNFPLIISRIKPHLSDPLLLFLAR
jgi:hypothetical protein